MKVLVTGGTGFVGQHVVSCLKSRGHDVLIATRQIPKEGQVQFFFYNPEWMSNVLDKNKIECIVHLSAKASVKQSMSMPFEAYESNVSDSISLLKVLEKKYRNIKFVYASSAEVYKPDTRILTESSSLSPVSLYGLSKMFVDEFVRVVARSENLKWNVVRPFNTIGVGQSDVYVIASFAKQIVEMKRGIREKKLSVGNIEVCRDFVDVRDVARAYVDVCELDDVGEVYNICSGESVCLSECVSEMISLVGLKDVKIEVDSSKLRVSDPERIVGTYNKLKRKVGWGPKTPIDQTLSDILQYWEGKD